MSTRQDFLPHLLVSTVAPVSGLVLASWLAWNIETRFMPIVEDFRITSATFTPQGVVVSGTINKVRACELVNMTVARMRDGVPSIVLDQKEQDLFTTDSSLGLHTWGPITIPLDPGTINGEDRIKVVALHRCHSLWLQSTEYSRVLWSEIKKMSAPLSTPVPSAPGVNKIHYSIKIIS